MSVTKFNYWKYTKCYIKDYGGHGGKLFRTRKDFRIFEIYLGRNETTKIPVRNENSHLSFRPANKKDANVLLQLMIVNLNLLKSYDSISANPSKQFKPRLITNYFKK